MKKIIIKFDDSKCKGCKLCIHVCPKAIIDVNLDQVNDKGYHTAGVSDQDLCIGCSNCAIMCPDGAISIYRQESI